MGATSCIMSSAAAQVVQRRPRRGRASCFTQLDAGRSARTTHPRTRTAPVRPWPRLRVAAKVAAKVAPAGRMRRSAHARDRIISLHTGEAILQTETHRASLSDHPGELQQVLACAEANSRMYTIDSAACASPPLGSMCRMKRCMPMRISYHCIPGRPYRKRRLTDPHSLCLIMSSSKS